MLDETTIKSLKGTCRDHAFTTDEVIDFTGVDKFTFRNWLGRGVVEIGKKHRLGRWLFSTVDMIRVSTMVDLVEIGMAPSLASEVCDEVVALFDFYIDAALSDLAKGTKRPHPLLAPLDHYVAIVIVNKGKISFQHAFRRGAEFVFVEGQPTNIARDQDRLLPVLGTTHIVVAAGLIIEDIIGKVRQTLEQDASTRSGSAS